MTILPLVIAPDPILDKIADPVDQVNDDIRSLVDGMIESMRHYNGSGIAAPQLGVSKRIFILDISSYYQNEMPLYVVINPEFTFPSKKKWVEKEGCLSLPVGERIAVERPYEVTMKYLDYHGKEQSINADDWLARGFLHENDHLDGITGLHYLSKLKREMMIKKLKKYKESNKLI